jgi:hypothetical protein
MRITKTTIGFGMIVLAWIITTIGCYTIGVVEGTMVLVMGLILIGMLLIFFRVILGG